MIDPVRFGVKIDEEDKAIILLFALPGSYNCSYICYNPLKKPTYICNLMSF